MRTLITLQIQTLLVLLIVSLGSQPSVGATNLKIKCIDSERQALLNFKQGLQDYSNVLSSWSNKQNYKDCCSNWIGVKCSNNSGHITMLDLSSTTLSHQSQSYSTIAGNISPSLIELQDLNYLNLSSNGFNGTFPTFFSNLSKLTHLDLSSNFLSGEISQQLSNVSTLEFLDLSNNIGITIKNLNWVSNLSSLKQLSLTRTNLRKANDWIQSISKHPFLKEIRLGNCGLPNTMVSHQSSSNSLIINSSTSISILDLSSNYLSSSIYQWLFNISNSLIELHLSENQLKGFIPKAFGNMKSLKFLDLSKNELEGEIPNSFLNMSILETLNLQNNHLQGSISEDIGNMTSLQVLILSNNKIGGEIPKSIGNLCNLKQLYLSFNQVSGHIPEFTQSSSKCKQHSLHYLHLNDNQIIGSLPNVSLFSSLHRLSVRFNNMDGNISQSVGTLFQLQILDASSNSFKGVFSETHLSKLSNLWGLSLSSNPFLTFNVGDNWVPPFQLQLILLSSLKLGPSFPKWIFYQKQYSLLDISNSGISDSIPEWFWPNLSPNLFRANLSFNQIFGTIPNYSIGSLLNSAEIDLSSNQLSGSIPRFLFQAISLRLSKNKFSKLSSLCDVHIHVNLKLLDISHNQFSQDLSDCWERFKELRVLILAHNKISGKIPASIGQLTQIQSLHLGNNSFSGEFPSLKNCNKLKVLDVGQNEFLGKIPKWVGESLKDLVILILRSNNFFGGLSSSLCQLEHLQMLDMSLNKISGTIPSCFNNFAEMKRLVSDNVAIDHLYAQTWGSSVGQLITYSDTYYNDQAQLVWKGTLSEYKSTLGLVKIIDLSSNKLNGEIPGGIEELIGLVSLNLSRNNLSGQIPSNIGMLERLDVLDLSNNMLFGSIPSSMSRLDRVSVLDLSNNNLSGKIPISTQLQTFSANAFSGNLKLCGLPLSKKCSNEDSEGTTSNEEESDDKLVTLGFFVSAALGFIIGFWGVCGTLVFKKSWRYAYFNFFSDVGDWIYVKVTLQKAKLLKLITS